MKRLMKIGTCLAVVLCFLLQPFTGSVASAADSFSDIKGHWAKSYIELLAERGIVNGYKGAFLPNNALTKAEAATLICSASGIQPNEAVSTSLTDIEGHWGQKYISVLPVVTASNNQFSPNAQITRADFTQMVVGAMYLDISKADTSTLKQKFKDWTTVSEAAMPYITVAVEKGIISGYDDATFRPNHTLTRAEACVILKQAFFPDLKIKPSQYYIDTVADIDHVSSMAVALDKTLYYVDNNTVYHIVNGKREAVLTGNTTKPFIIPTEDILEQQEIGFSLRGFGVNFSLESVREQLEKDSEVEFVGFYIVDIMCDHATGKTYALAWSEIPQYNPQFSYAYEGNLYMMMLIDLKEPTKLASAAFSSEMSDKEFGISHGSEGPAYFAGMPVCGYSIHNNEVLYTSDSDNILRWNATTGKITLISSELLNITDRYSEIYGTNNAPYMCNDSYIQDLSKERKFIQVNGFKDNSETKHWSGVWEHDFYVRMGHILNGQTIIIYRVSLPDTNASEIKAEILVDARNIESKDGIPIDLSSATKFWTPDADGTLYFVDPQNKIIRKIYGQ